MDHRTPDVSPGHPCPPAAPPHAARLTDFLLARRRAVLGLTLILTVLAVWRAFHLELRTSLAELLPEKHPALVTLHEFTRTVRLPDGREVHGAGTAAVFAAMLESIRRDGPIVTAVAFLGVVLLVSLVTWKRRGAYLVLLALLAGVLWMVGGAAALGVRVNFLNFIALPITFGIGVDYAINVFLRACEEGPAPHGERGPQDGQTGSAITATGAAVGLCSLTTIIGYAALLGADNQGLRSLGALAILGEFACLGAALVILPAALRLREARGGRRPPALSLSPAPSQAPTTSLST
jgi:predicted RND superfamily exporter protein